jgi:sugar phosphate permease
MAFAFVPMSIGALAGVGKRDAGVASGLLNQSQQIGGAIGVAIATTIATTYTTRFATHHHVGSFAPAALTHGFVVAFYVLAGISLAGAVLSALLIESEPAAVEEAAIELGELDPVIEAAA